MTRTLSVLRRHDSLRCGSIADLRPFLLVVATAAAAASASALAFDYPAATFSSPTRFATTGATRPLLRSTSSWSWSWSWSWSSPRPRPGLGMQSGATDFANMALRQSPSSTTFYTNKMCPYAQKVWIALEVGQCPYSAVEIPLYGPGGKPDWFLDINPDGQVPVLTCFGGAKIYMDSEYILTKLCDGAVEGGSRLLPSPWSSPSSSSSSSNDQEDGDAAAAAAAAAAKDVERSANEWRHLIENRLNPVGKKAVLGQNNKTNVNELMSLLRELNDKIGGATNNNSGGNGNGNNKENSSEKTNINDRAGPYLCGTTRPTVADCAAFPFLWRIDQEFGPLSQDPDDGCEKIRNWLDTCEANPAFAKTIQSSWWWWW